MKNVFYTTKQFLRKSGVYLSHANVQNCKLEFMGKKHTWNKINNIKNVYIEIIYLTEVVTGHRLETWKAKDGPK